MYSLNNTSYKVINKIKQNNIKTKLTIKPSSHDSTY